MFLFNPILSTKNNVSKTKKICAFVLLVLFSVCFFACSNLYESTETVNLSFDLPHSRSDTNNERLLKASLYDKNGIILQQRETVFSTETVNVEFSKVLVNSEIYVSVELYNDNELQFTGKSELTKIKPGKNVIKLTLIQYDDEIPDDNPEGGTETPETGGNTGSESGGETGGSTDGNETEDPETPSEPEEDVPTYNADTLYSPDKAVSLIRTFTNSGNYPLLVGGACTEDQLENLASAIKSLESTEGTTISLNLNEVTGLTSIPAETFKDCTRLAEIILPGASSDGYGGIYSIGYKAFSGCTDLSNIFLPSSITSIADSAFAGCDNLTYNVRYGGDSAAWERIEIGTGNDSLGTPYVNQTP